MEAATMTQQQLPPATSPAPEPRKFGVSYAIAMSFIVLLLVVGIPIAYVFVMWNRAALDAPGRFGSAMTQFAAEALRPKLSVNQVVFSSVEEMHKEAKLLVLKTTVDADVTSEEGSSSWGVYWGTNVARVAVKGAHVQYSIDLQAMGTADFLYDDATQTLTVIAPHPQIDTDMVGIDPASIQTLDLRGGWMRWDKQDTRSHAIAELRPNVIIAASKPFLKKQADEAGREALTNLLSPMAQNLRAQGVKLDVKYRGE
jgi:hypothetical protein